MTEQQSEQPVVFIRRLLTRLRRELENCNGRSDHNDNVLYRIDWLNNSLTRYLGAYMNPHNRDEHNALFQNKFITSVKTLRHSPRPHFPNLWLLLVLNTICYVLP